MAFLWEGRLQTARGSSDLLLSSPPLPEITQSAEAKKKLQLRKYDYFSSEDLQQEIDVGAAGSRGDAGGRGGRWCSAHRLIRLEELRSPMISATGGEQGFKKIRGTVPTRPHTHRQKLRLIRAHLPIRKTKIRRGKEWPGGEGGSG